jgi:hypothetical protein
MLSVVAYAGVVIVLGYLVWRVGVPHVCTIGANSYAISRVTDNSFEYRPQTGARAEWQWHNRGTVRLFFDGREIRARGLLAECSGVGDILYIPDATDRPATLEEQRLFQTVCRRIRR